MSDDMDSYYSCRVIRKHTGIEVGGFYSFDYGLYIDKNYSNEKEPIYVDLSISSGKSFDNHYTFIRNPESVNPNVIKQTYFKKYNGGTLALVSSLYEDLEAYTETKWMALLATDSFYYGYYNKDGAFRNVNLYWYDMLGISDYVVPILERKTADDFSVFSEHYRLDEKISVDKNGKLICRNNGIELPPLSLELVQPIKKRFMPKWEAVVLYEKQRDNIMVSNEIFSGRYVLNLKQ